MSVSVVPQAEKIRLLREVMQGKLKEGASPVQAFPFAWEETMQSLRIQSRGAQDVFLVGGVPRGAITEIVGPAGSGKSELVLRFLAQNPELHAAWIEESLTAYPTGFSRSGVSLERLLFIEGGRDLLWCAHQVLRSQIFGAVILCADQIQEMDIRRLQLAAERSLASVLLLKEVPTCRGGWSIRLQLEVSRKLNRSPRGRRSDARK